MTEKEKMERGEWHDANFDEELLAQRAKAEALCYDFNMAKPGSDAQLDALKSLLDTDLPGGLTVLSPAYFDYGSKTTFYTASHPLKARTATWVSRRLCPSLSAITAGLARTCQCCRELPSAAVA